MRILAAPKNVPGWNPYNALLYGALERNHPSVTVQEYSPRALAFGRWDILHLHWPESILEHPDAMTAWRWAIALFARMRVARAKGCRIVWTVHNLRPHEARHPGLEAWFWKRFLPLVDGRIHLSAASVKQHHEAFPGERGKTVFVIPHGHYRPLLANESHEDARRILGPGRDEFVLGFFGKIRPYKNVPGLIQSFRPIKDPHLRLWVVGAPDSEEARAVLAAAQGDGRITLTLGRQEWQDLSTRVHAMDLVVLPYRRILNSGAALHALSLDRPVLVPALGSLPELQQAVGTDWVRTYEGDLTTRVLEEAVEWGRRPRRGAAPLQAFDWDAIAAQTHNTYRSVLGRRS